MIFNQSGNKVSVGGKTIIVPNGSSVSVINNKVFINGEPYDGDNFDSKEQIILKIVVEGSIEELKTDANVEVHGKVNKVKADGNVVCTNVDGNVKAGGNVACGKISGKVTAGGNIVGFG